MKKVIAFSLLIIAAASALAEAASQATTEARSAPLNTLVTALWTLFGIFIGAAGSHWLSLARDRRKEFNEIADPLRLALKAEKKKINPHYSSLDVAAASIVADMIGGKNAAKLNKAVERYSQARQEWVVQDAAGQPSYSQTIHIEEAIDEILKYLARR